MLDFGAPVTVDLVNLLRLGYLAAAAGVLIVFIVPPFRDRFLTYGARASKPAASAEEKKVDRNLKQAKTSNPFSRVLDTLADLTVPHEWFTSFYALSTTLSAFWPGEVLILKGPLYHLVADHVRHGPATMNFKQVQLVWLMLLVQGTRRLYESVTYESGSNSRMWIGHWVLGILFYAATSIGVWIEGLCKTIFGLIQIDFVLIVPAAAIESHQFSVQDIFPTAPSLRAFIAIPLFLLASGFQYDCHSYLASLKKLPSDASKTTHDGYKLPEHPAFHRLIAPHYTAECVIYLSLAIAAAPEGQMLNGTMVAALVFVAVNLGVTASGTREWYVARFGEEKVKGRWRLVPGVW